MKRLLLSLSFVFALFLGGLFVASAAGCTPFLVASGGTGNCAFTSGAVLYGNGTGKISTTTAGTNGFVLSLSGGIPTWVSTSSINNGLTSYDAFTHPAAGQSATTSTIILTTGGLVINAASSTIQGNLVVNGNATTTNATSTNFAVLSNLLIPNGASVGSNVAGSVVLDTTNDQLKVGDGTTQAIFDQRRFYSFGYATSTTWTGTTTLTIAPYPVAGTLTGVTCTTNVGTLGVDLFYGPVPTHLAYIPTASTTANFFNWTSSNTPGANASSSVSFGTPASSPTSIACTATFTISGT